MEKAFVAQRVATKLFATEAAVDKAMVEATELMADMQKARQDVNASLVFADEAQVKLMDAIRALGHGRRARPARRSQAAPRHPHQDDRRAGQESPERPPDCHHAGSRLKPNLGCNSLTG